LVRLFHGNVWLVSKCGPRIPGLTLEWLEHHEFYRQTGLPRGQVAFCSVRHQKRVHCTRIGATHFVDDRLDVLGHLHGAVRHLFLFGHQKPGVNVPLWVERVLD